MSDADEITRRLQTRRAYLGVRDKTTTPDRLPTRTMPFALTLPDCRSVAAHLVTLIRNTYVQRRRNRRMTESGRPDQYGDRPLPDWDGGYDWQGNYHPPVWARIARATLDRGFDVADYVEKTFARAADATSPLPNMLLSATALDAYDRTYMGTVIDQRHFQREMMEQQFASEIIQESSLGLSRTQAALVVLRNRTNRLRPFFRYWVVARLDLNRPEYRQIWATWRGPALLEYAASVRAHAAAYNEPVLDPFRATVAMTKEALADLIEGDPAGWIRADDNASGPGPVEEASGPAGASPGPPGLDPGPPSPRTDG